MARSRLDFPVIFNSDEISDTSASLFREISVPRNTCFRRKRRPPIMPGVSMNVFCRTGPDEWRQVLSHDAEGLDAATETMTFQEVWIAAGQSRGSPLQLNPEPVRRRWEDLFVPLPELPGPACAYALTYRAHQEEAQLEKIFCFDKRCEPESASMPIPYRPALDYEAEMGLLLHRNEPERFGFLFANDLTDREAQVHGYDRRSPAAGFSAAKSFPGALHVGPLLVIAGENLWPELEVRLEVNGDLRQHVKARECLLTPREFHRQLFASPNAGDRALVLTGTTGGTIFQSPTQAQRLRLLAGSGFSLMRARKQWLRAFQFLRIGDRLEMKSEILGTSHATIVASAE